MKTRIGREIEPPNPRAKSKQAVTKNARAFDRWLLREGFREAAIREDWFMVYQLADMDYVKMADGERTMLNLYLFGVEEVRLAAIDKGSD